MIRAHRFETLAIRRSVAVDNLAAVTIFDDLEAEEERLEAILQGLAEADWRRESGAPGWSIADVVLHLAQSEEIVVSSSRTSDSSLRAGADERDLDAVMNSMVSAERSGPAVVFDRWCRARREALEILRTADPQATIAWATNPLRPATLATTRLAEHWAHGLDITTPLDIDFEDTDRLCHVAWLAHRTLPYAFALAGEQPAQVYCELSGPRGATWKYGSLDAPSRITGPAGDFCRVGARRLTPDRSRLVARGPRGDAALLLLRNYAA